jgi:hypothetical protein
MDKETELRNTLKRVRRELSAIEDKRACAENVKLIGQCFKYRNNYSCPEKSSDYWWLYCCVLSADEYGLRLFEFQTDKHGRIEIRPEGHAVNAHSMQSGYVPISEAEYCKAWAQTLKKIQNLSAAAR